MIKKLFIYLPFFLFSDYLSAQQIIPFSQFGKFGLIDTQTKKIVSPPLFKEINYISNQAILVKDDEKYFFINKDGKPINDRKFCLVNNFSENMVSFLEDCEKGKYGFADSKGQVLIAPQYSKVTDFKEELAAVFLEKNWQYINFRGQKMIQIADSFSVAKPFQNGYGIIGKNINYTNNQQYEIGYFQVINKQGKTVVDTRKVTQLYQKNTPNFNPKIQFNYIKQIKENLIVLSSVYEDFDTNNQDIFKLEVYEAVLNLSNNTFIELPQEKSIEIISSKLYKIESEKEKKKIQVFALQAYNNKPFQVIQNAKKIGQFQENRLPFLNTNNDWGYIDETGKEVILAQYNFASAFYQGKAIVEEKNKMLVMLDKNGEAINIDKKGTLLKKSFQASIGEEVENSVFTLKFAKRFGFINQNDKYLPFGMFVYGFDSILVDINTPPFYVKKQKGWAMIKNNDKNMLPNLYQQIIPLPVDENNMVIKYFSFVKLDNKYAIYHESGNITSPFIFDKIQNTQTENIFLGNIEGKNALVNVVGDILLTDFEQILSEKYEHFIIQKNGKIGLIDQYFKETLPSIYDKLEWYDNNNIYVTQNGKIGLFKLSENKFSLPCAYTSIGNLREKYVTIQQNDKFGLMEKTPQGFKMAFEAEYQAIKLEIFDNEKYFLVKKNQKFGLLNMNLETLLPTEFNFISNKSDYGQIEKYFLVQKNGKIGYTTRRGKTVIPCEYEKINLFRSFANGWAFAKKNGFWGAIDTLNRIKIPFEYDSLCNRYAETKLIDFDAKKGKKWGIISDVNEILVPIQYDEVGRIYFNNDTPFGIKIKNKWGFSDKEKKILVKPQFDDAKQPFESKQLNPKIIGKSFVACVKRKQKWGLVDMTGKKIIAFKFDEVEYSDPKSEFPIKAKINQKWFYVNWKGETKQNND